MTLVRFLKIAPLAAALLFAACSTDGGYEPFSYSADRCRGADNQCQTDCIGLDDGPARGACIQRCLTEENGCYALGGDGESSLAVGSGVGAARNRQQMEEDFQRWKRQKEREAAREAPADTEAPDVE